MAEDIVPELLKRIQKDFRESYGADKKIRAMQKLAEMQEADGKDLDAYAVRTGELVAKALRDNVSGETLPDGKMYYNIANRILPAMLEEGYGHVADMSDQVQDILNKNAGIHIAAQRPELNEDRVEGLVNLAATADQYEDIRKQLEGDVVNFHQSVATDSVRKNADFQYKAGLSPKVVRTAAAGCCKWCTDLAGTYEYATVKAAGNEVWQRHRGCGCVVEYDPGNGKLQNAHTKAWRSDEDRARRIQYSRETDEERQKREEYTRQERIDADKYVRSEINRANWSQLRRGAADIGSKEEVYFNKYAEYKVDINKYTDAINKQISASAKKVAEYGSDRRFEYSAIVDLNTGKEVDFGTSEEYNSVNYYYKYLKEHLDGNFVMIHNHNTENGFSLPDIQELTMWENLDAVVAVTNNGITYSVVSNGVRTTEYLPLVFSDIGKDIKDRIKREEMQVEVAVGKYSNGGVIIHDGRTKRNN